MQTSRLEAFSDGVFAIAITLLVLEIPVPQAGEEGLWHALLDQWPSLASYVVSFSIIGIIWVNHHAVLDHVLRADRGLLFLNLLFLLWVAFIPFPTALLADNLQGDSQHVAAAVYSGTMALMGVSFGMLWLYVSRRRRLMGVDLTNEQIARMTRKFVAGAPIYALAVAVAFVSAPAALAVNAGLAIYYALELGGGIAGPTREVKHADDR
jgi:uncharacterized membrane protein